MLQVDPNCKERVCSAIPLAGVPSRTTLRERPLIRDKPHAYSCHWVPMHVIYIVRFQCPPSAVLVVATAGNDMRKAIISGSCFNSAVAPFWLKTAAAVPNPAATNDD